MISVQWPTYRLVYELSALLFCLHQQTVGVLLQLKDIKMRKNMHIKIVWIMQSFHDSRANVSYWWRHFNTFIFFIFLIPHRKAPIFRITTFASVTCGTLPIIFNFPTQPPAPGLRYARRLKMHVTLCATVTTASMSKTVVRLNTVIKMSDQVCVVTSSSLNHKKCLTTSSLNFRSIVLVSLDRHLTQCVVCMHVVF